VAETIHFITKTILYKL